MKTVSTIKEREKVHDEGCLETYAILNGRTERGGEGE